MAFHLLVALAGTTLVLAGAMSFMPNAPQLPVLSAGDFPNIVIMALGAGWALLGAVQGIRTGKSRLAKALLVLNLLLAAIGAGGMTWWVLDYSYRLPPPVQVQSVPDFELTDQQGNAINALSMRGKPYVLIFSRGVW
ncbi:MAG: hypothetical protein KF696_11190 [Planctomycetes bacterium]|nr:hypothetical protein [Planctomycetota bacterium]MCW8135784.1 hypothetical protein [Planctomycetota bacterium]